jgi:hypothetical protein
MSERIEHSPKSTNGKCSHGRHRIDEGVVSANASDSKVLDTMFWTSGPTAINLR